jgi:hypothetical protein
MTLTISLAPSVEAHLHQLADELAIPLEMYIDHLLIESTVGSLLRPRMLAVQKADGSMIGVPFRLIYRISYDCRTASGPQMTFYHVGGTIRVEGPDIRQLVDDYRDNKVFCIQEYDPTGQVAPEEDAHVVERITVTHTDPSASVVEDLISSGG